MLRPSCFLFLISSILSSIFLVSAQDLIPNTPGCIETVNGCLFIDLIGNSNVPKPFDNWGGRSQQPNDAQQASAAAASSSSSINWTIVAPLIAGAVFAVVLFVAVLIYARRRKETARRLSHESQLEGVAVETLTSTPVIEKETTPVEGQTNVTITTEVPVVTLGETQA